MSPVVAPSHFASGLSRVPRGRQRVDHVEWTTIEDDARTMLKRMSDVQRAKLGLAVLLAVHQDRSLHGWEKLRADPIARTVFLALAKFPFGMDDPEFPKIRRLTPSLALAAYAFINARIAAAGTGTRAARGAKLELATRAIAMAYGIAAPAPPAAVQRRAAKARHAGQEEAKKTVLKLYRTKQHLQKTVAARRINKIVGKLFLRKGWLKQGSTPEQTERTIRDWLYKYTPSKR